MIGLLPLTLAGATNIEKLTEDLYWASHLELNHWQYSTDFSEDVMQKGVRSVNWSTLKRGFRLIPAGCIMNSDYLNIICGKRSAGRPGYMFHWMVAERSISTARPGERPG